MLKKRFSNSLRILSIALCLLFLGCSTSKSGKTIDSSSLDTLSTKTSTVEVSKLEEKSDEKSEADAIYNDFYIGEIYESGFAYIEQFEKDRTPFYGAFTYENYPDSIIFYTIDGSGYIYNSIYDSESNDYIPLIEEDAQYYTQGEFGESEQYTLRYKSSDDIKLPSIGIALFNYDVNNIDFSNMGKKRLYSESEYDRALVDVEQSLEDREKIEGTFRERTIDDSIIGAEQICTINFEDTKLKIVLSKYFFLGVESTADVYVIDFIDEEGNIIETVEKYNGVAY
jgi:hypothetical protein